MSDEGMDFGNPLVRSIQAAQSLRDIVRGPTPRFRKTELNNNLRQINILRQKFSSKFSEDTQRVLEENVPIITRGIMRNDFERVELFSSDILDALLDDGIPLLVNCICGSSPEQK